MGVPALISWSSSGTGGHVLEAVLAGERRALGAAARAGIAEHDHVDEVLGELVADDGADVGRHLLDRLVAVDALVVAPLAVEVEHGQRLLVVLAQAVANDGLVVVRAARRPPALEQAPDRGLLVHLEADQAAERRVQLQHQAFEDVALDVRAREAVEEEPVRLRVLRDRLLDQLHDDLVGDETAGGDDALRLQAQLRLRRQLLAQQVAGGDVEEVELLDEGLRLRPLAGPGRAEQRDVQHLGVPLSVVARACDTGVVARVPKIHGRRRPVPEADGSGGGPGTLTRRGRGAASVSGVLGLPNRPREEAPCPSVRGASS